MMRDRMKAMDFWKLAAILAVLMSALPFAAYGADGQKSAPAKKASSAKPASAGHSFGRTVTLEVTPEQAERINVAAELGKLSLTLRSITTAEAPTDGTLGGFAKTPEIKPIWAGDVSPALGEALAPSKIVIAEQPIVEVFHGTKPVSVKSQ